MPTGHPNTITECVIEGCGSSGGRLRRGYCSAHYTRWRLRGDPLAGPPVRELTLEYTGAHNRVVRAKGRARDHSCIECGVPAKQWAYDHKDPNELVSSRRGFVFSADPEHYVPMCVPCHKRFDAEAA